MLPFLLPALAGQVFTEMVTLDEVLDRAVVVAVVRLETPASRAVKLPVPPAGLRSCGTYDYGVTRVEVREVLRTPPTGGVAVGQWINVFPANSGDLVDLTHRACVDGTSKSPIFEQFAGDAPADGATRIVALAWEPPYGWREAVAGAWVAPEKRELVERALAAHPGPELEPASAPLLCVVDADCGAGRCAEMRCSPR